MPRRKRIACDTRKTRLVFLESPKQGQHHVYGSPPDKAAHPVCAPTRSLDHNTSSSWVSPQFDQTEEMHFPARRRLRHLSSNSSMQIRTRDPNHSDLRASGTRSSAYKFPTLSFTRRGAAELTRKTSVCVRRRTLLPVITEQGRLSPLPQESSCTNIPSPLDVRTPETSFHCVQVPERATETLVRQTPKSRGVDEIAGGYASPVPGGSEEEIAGGYASPVPGGSEEVLARDTPEHEYGLRITWRRRQELMK
ncbi:hypothetical protein GDO86_004878 [Hymenochirus boettgeri]|uniref:Uncharacterized protein n=1 Tax=Hymenochirus boettgeri TaxID=247094 RepID=A0A8T2J3V8_9PIPI|nr:hypothetical protein GDO86_004878 [Hymenochirus boettgeri]